jgi:hypothetical protein
MPKRVSNVSGTNPQVPLTTHLRVRTAVPPPQGREHCPQSDQSVHTKAAAAGCNDCLVDTIAGAAVVVVVVLVVVTVVFVTVFGVDLKAILSHGCPLHLTEFGTSPIAKNKKKLNFNVYSASKGYKRLNFLFAYSDTRRNITVQYRFTS